MDEKVNKELAKTKVVARENVKKLKKNNHANHYVNDKILWTELRLRYLDSLLQINIEKSDINVDDDINKLVRKLDDILIDEK